MDSPQKAPSSFMEKNKKELMIGCLPLYPPVELFASMGLTPVVLWNLKTKVKDLNESDRYIQSYTCGIAKELVQFVLSATGQMLDGIFTYNACDTLRNLPEILEEGNHKKGRNLPMLSMHIPQVNRTQSRSDQYLKNQIARLIAKIQSDFGVSFSGKKFEQTVKKYEKMRNLCRKAEDLVAQNTISFSNFSNVILNNYFLPVKEQIQQLEMLIDNTGCSKKSSAKRIMLSGIMPLPLKILKAMEAAGLCVVANDIAAMRRSYAYSPRTTDSPEDYYLDFFNNRFPCTTLLYKTDERLKIFLDMVERYQVEGVIFSGEKFCEYEYLEYPYLEQRLKEMGVSVLTLEFSVDDKQNLEAYTTRVQAFAEMIYK